MNPNFFIGGLEQEQKTKIASKNVTCCGSTTVVPKITCKPGVGTTITKILTIPDEIGSTHTKKFIIPDRIEMKKRRYDPIRFNNSDPIRYHCGDP